MSARGVAGNDEKVCWEATYEAEAKATKTERAERAIAATKEASGRKDGVGKTTVGG